MFADTELTDDAFLNGRLQLLQPATGYRAAGDPVLLAASCLASPGQSVLDLGCGAGAAALCLGRRVPLGELAGLELQPAYADLARRNGARNHIPLMVHEGDVRHMPPALRRDFDHVICNPPYYDAACPSPKPDRATACHVQEVPLAFWLSACARRTRPGGWVSLIAPAQALPELLANLGKLGSAQILPLAAREGRPAKRIILRARKGGKGAFELLAPLITHHGMRHDKDQDHHTDALQAILRHGGDLSAQFGR